jgi:hypothetical protein
MITGTHHFISRKAAEKYYEFTGDPKAYVAEAIASGRIEIGEPKVDRLRQTLEVDADGRYQIRDLKYRM